MIYSAYKIEQINFNLFLDTYNANKITIGVNEMGMNDTEMSVRWNNKAWSILEKSVTSPTNNKNSENDEIWDFSRREQ